MFRDDVVFAVEGERDRWRDVVLAAVRWNAWSVVERMAREGAACASHAAATGTALPAAALDEAAQEFRYERDLLTAKSMEAWLERWGLSVRDWTSHFSRKLHRERLAPQAARIVEQYPIAADEAASLALIDAICSGAIARWKRKLASRAAVYSGAGRTNGSGQASVAHAVDAPVLAVLGIDEPAAAESLARLDRIEEAFRQFRTEHLSDRALNDFVGARLLEWMRFDCRIMAFPDESMAAEAALLLTEDNEGFTGVYSAAHAEPRAARFFLEDMDPAVRDRFIGARAGDLVGPLHVKNEYALYLVMQKSPPNMSDPEVRERAEAGVLKMLLDRQVANRVRWQKADGP